MVITTPIKQFTRDRASEYGQQAVRATLARIA